MTYTKSNAGLQNGRRTEAWVHMGDQNHGKPFLQKKKNGTKVPEKRVCGAEVRTRVTKRSRGGEGAECNNKGVNAKTPTRKRGGISGERKEIHKGEKKRRCSQLKFGNVN